MMENKARKVFYGKKNLDIFQPIDKQKLMGLTEKGEFCATILRKQRQLIRKELFIGRRCTEVLQLAKGVMKKKSLLIIFLLSTLYAKAQVDSLKPYERTSFYLYLDSVQGVLESFKYIEPVTGSVKCTENYGKPEPSFVFRLSQGKYYYKDWYNGLRIEIGDMFISFPVIVNGNMKNAPTRNRQFEVSAEGISIRFYNDTQTRPEMREVSADKPYTDDTGTIMEGSASVRPQDMFKEQFGCTTGTRTEDVKVLVGNKTYTCKMQVTCQHKNYRLVVKLGGGGYTRIGGQWKKTGFGGAGGAGDGKSPWKFTHVITYKLDFNTLAKAMNMSRQEMAQTLIAEGGIYIASVPVLVSRNRGYNVFDPSTNVGRSRWDSDIFEPLNVMLLSMMRNQTGLSQQFLNEQRPIAFQREKERIEHEKQIANEQYMEDLRKKREQAQTLWKDYYDRGLKTRDDSVLITNQHKVSSNIGGDKNLVSPLLLDSACRYSNMVVNLSLELKDTLGYFNALSDNMKTYRQLYYSLYIDREIMHHNSTNYPNDLYRNCSDIIQSTAINRMIAAIGIGDIERGAKNYKRCVEQYCYAKREIENKNNEKEFSIASGISELTDTINYKLTIGIIDYLDHEGNIEDIESPFSGINDLLKKYPNNLEYLDLKGRILLRIRGKSSMKDWWKENILSVDPSYADKETVFYKEMVDAGILKAKKKK